MRVQSDVMTGDIYLVKFHPGYGSEFQKYRPAVVASSKVTRSDSRFALIVPLTTNTEIMNKDSEFVINNQSLDKESLLLCWYLWTIDRSRLIKKLGVLSLNDTERMIRTIKDLF